MTWKVDSWGTWTDEQSGKWRLRAFIGPVVEDAATGGGALVQVQGSTILESEQTISAITLIRLQTDGESVTEISIPVRYLTRYINEVFTLVESLTRVISTLIVREQNESVSADETLSDARQLVWLLNLLVAVGEGSVIVRSLLRLVNETEDLSSIQLDVLRLLRQLDSTVTVSEANQFIRLIVRLRNEIEQILEQQIPVQALLALLGEQLGIPESIVHSISALIISTVGEQTNVGEGTSAVLSALLVLFADENVSLLEGLLRQGNFVRSATEQVSIDEALRQVLNLIRWFGEQIGISEGWINKLGAAVRVITETLQLSDGKSWNLGRILQIDERLDLGEVLRMTAAVISFLVATLVIKALLSGRIEVNADEQ